MIIRQTIQFNSNNYSILTQLNIYRFDFMFSQGNLFKINEKYSFKSKLCEINARFLFNGYFLPAGLYLADYQNLI
ncbi:unnamed protein product [Adineta steineri]|uniref:Uncharacterized protein n=1 Tax=Adineta steineri TaxID=433720 RepID=A0A818WDZ6_9BILA|nr:unnamed protein product [Adineta steineri]CAF3724419.1 unnamed protein product [Adineta steineri]